jgi:hypothetical protein
MAPPRPGVLTDIPAFYTELAKEARFRSKEQS